MSKYIKLKKGLDINLAGKAEKKIAECDQPETFAVKPSSFHGIIRPKVTVDVGDKVKSGTVVLFDKKNERVKYVAPVSGEVVEIRRGEKRKILEVVIRGDKDITYLEHKKYSISEINNLEREAATSHMLESGVWPNLIQRPFGIVADPDETPKAIFISAFDSSPLAPDYDFLVKGKDNYLQAGVEILNKFTSGTIHLNINASAEVSQMFAHLKGVQLNKFTGPHPAGNVGVQIHHLDPISKGDVVWTISPMGVIQIGKLFLDGVYDASKIIALVGSEVNNPQYYKTFTGSSISKFIEGNLKSDHVRLIAGNVLTGEKIEEDGHLGFFDNMLSVIPEGDKHEMLGWALPQFKKHSFHRAFGLVSFLMPKKEYNLDTNTNGEPRAFVQTGVFEKVLPMDILPTYLIKAIIAEDYDEMEALGLYEVI
ncbi:MAG: Na(+)-translocating NADH-quinone reductase subunit A, partial [Cyclobacteriaceae bacterium]|nr:Na(+)-translocating NADH-quinone reductase subunit A [Cyclobacteriaceae bacterium]